MVTMVMIAVSNIGGGGVSVVMTTTTANMAIRIPSIFET